MGKELKVRRKRRVGLLGGSFNPAHEGHLHISKAAFRRLGLDEVWWLVSPQNPLKSIKGMANLQERMESAEKMASHPRIIVTDIETRLQTRYTADTLMALQQNFLDCQFVWLMGADNLRQISQWKKWQHIFNTVPIAVFGRSGYDLGALSGKAAQRFKRCRVPEHGARSLTNRETPSWTFLAIRRHPESATRIRNATKKKRL
ncbi:nicotinate-nucleotide adenylyltransferase [Curvivirga aplysinae]|uniref:nicotinate-nucleotide adenylyltransferase n=1 Tax=Curvivirga aplysinae TaxID=2529852 RepID=UPI0012BC9C9D|nr:nicotinate-nucleotide adenylyltransferase [Curvivirga aplysinae]MTI08844.1 nicotinate-nucleotide adenylyltransferase [Curvivirga aplysinae]